VRNQTENETGDDTTRVEQPGEDARSGTTVRCEVPEDAASTLRLGPKGEAPAAFPSVTRFDDRGEIARGGMSTVRTVFDRWILREVAMKTLAPERTFDELSRFVEEAQITGQLDHPNIVPVHDIEMDEKGLPTRFTMKLVRGQTLQRAIDATRGRDMTSEELETLLRAFIKVCDAVSFAHSRGVIHRDLKPSNIMIGSHGQVYVMDWGIALLRTGQRPSEHPPVIRSSADTLQEAMGTLSGTPSYMAPEQALGRTTDIDERTDVYGLGGVLYSILTRRPPHDGQSSTEDLQLARSRDVIPPAEIAPNAELPPFLCRVAMKALSTFRDDRHQSVEALKQDIETFLRGGGWFAQKRFAPGELIVREGDSADAAYIITQGQCELFKTVEGQKRFVSLLGPGDVFGETAIFGSTQRTASIVAHGEVQVLVVTRAALEHELDRSWWLRAFVQALAERFVEVDRALTRASVKP
jgi:eukaryotic-like serine/threonine-protein kinase